MNVVSNPQPLPSADWQWQAHLALLLTHGERGTSLKRCRHRGPLYVQKPFYPEGNDVAHLYLLHPPGGLVSGDTLTIEVQVAEGAQTLVTTPGAARIYKSRTAAEFTSALQTQNITLSIEENASIEWFPMETIVYNGAAACLETHIDVSPGGVLSAWEITCFGLPASEQLFMQGHFQQRYKITQQGCPLFVDHLYYSAEQAALFSGMAGMQSFSVSGFFISGPFTGARMLSTGQQQDLLSSIRAYLEQRSLSHHIAVTIVNGFCVSRYLGGSANQARDGFTGIWEIVRPLLLNRPACHPRIWLT